MAVGGRVTNIGSGAFADCTNLVAAEFLGNAPAVDLTAFQSDPATAYYLAGTAGWGATYAGLPTATWTLPCRLTVMTNGAGTVNVTPPGGGYLTNTLVRVTANAAPGWVFAGWSGAIQSLTNVIAFILNSNATLTANFAELPLIEFEPVGITNDVGVPVAFSAPVAGTAPLGYQWYLNGIALTNGPGGDTLILPQTSFADVGTYWLVVTNAYGVASSWAATLALTNAGMASNAVLAATETALRAAVSQGGWVSLGFNGPLTIASTIVITNDVVLDGSGFTPLISGGNAVRLFYIAPEVHFSATNLTLAWGNVTVTNSPATADGGALYNDGGEVVLTACMLLNNSVTCLAEGDASRGAAIFNNGGDLDLVQSAILGNQTWVGGYHTAPQPYGQVPNSGLSFGGALYNLGGSVTLTGCEVGTNACHGSGADYMGGKGVTMGGAICQAAGTLRITNCVFHYNWAMDASLPPEPYWPINPGDSGDINPAFGGAIAALGGTVVLDHTTFSLNSAAGGFAGINGTNDAAGVGGAIYSAAQLTINDCTLAENNAVAAYNYGYFGYDGCGGALYNAGDAVLNRCLVCSNNVAGGYSFHNWDFPTLGGDALGGGIFNTAWLAATNCTIAANSAVGGSGSGGTVYEYPPSFTGANGNACGGGVFNTWGATFIAECTTIASNSCVAEAGGWEQSYFGPVYYVSNGIAGGWQIANSNAVVLVHNTILAGSSNNAFGSISDSGYNLSSDASANLSSPTSRNGVDPSLTALGDHGGPSWTMGLLPGSPAIDTGDETDFPLTDQRGYVRPFGPAPDLGAFESRASPAFTLWINAAWTNGWEQLGYAALPAAACVLQSSTDLNSWIDLATNGPFFGGTKVLQSVDGEGFQQRFFRLLIRP